MLIKLANNDAGVIGGYTGDGEAQTVDASLPFTHQKSVDGLHILTKVPERIPQLAADCYRYLRESPFCCVT
jgi:hypothetical protein